MNDFNKLIYLRSLPNEHPVWRGLANGSIIRLTSRYAISRDFYVKLPRHRQQLIDIRAVGLSAHNAVVVGVSAARLLGLWTLPPVGEQVSVARPSKSVPRKQVWGDKVSYRKMAIPSEHILANEGVRCTSVARTCLDIARLWSFAEGLMAIDCALRRRLVSVDELRRMAVELGRVKGIAVAREAIKYASSLPEAPYESWARALIIEAGLGAKIRLQCELPGGFRPDLLVGDNLVVEIDGAVKYDGETFGKPTDAVIRAERQREKHIQNMGYIVLRFTPAELLQEKGRVVSEIRSALEGLQRRQTA
ncbi:MAG TPA: endonuclease domain-containing protein [Candidatus Corynebacterium faecipullorum]|nr:endonuclease domain-containing protein [Candidatus Corynebacterium faecipullorum]